MREIILNDSEFPKVWCKDNDTNEYNEFRPSDFDKWRQSITQLDSNVKMWMSALNSLEYDQSLWIYVS